MAESIFERELEFAISSCFFQVDCSPVVGVQSQRVYVGVETRGRQTVTLIEECILPSPWLLCEEELMILYPNELIVALVAIKRCRAKQRW
jgi:hypothetical protein